MAPIQYRQHQLAGILGILPQISDLLVVSPPTHMTGLTRDNSATIAFVEACYFSNGIDTAELNEWAEHIMISHPTYPDYVVDLREFNAPRFHFYRIVGFTPDRELSQAESKAISGIAYLRGREVIDGPSEQDAFTALIGNSHILDEFTSTFPFLQLPRQG